MSSIRIGIQKVDFWMDQTVCFGSEDFAGITEPVVLCFTMVGFSGKSYVY
ncbi:MAG: hypothetical protein K2P87_12100 [Lachnospiraceae bacterium]|nr:hypothetical protein [Lachnospiraceae bacterium]